MHSNGFSLVRKVFGIGPETINRRYAEFSRTLGEELLTPTRIYVKPVLELLERVTVRGISHITGGGFYENIPRSLREGLSAKVDKAAVKTPPVFEVIAREGGIPERDMFNTFNMGVGMSVIVPADEASAALDVLRGCGVESVRLRRTGRRRRGRDPVLTPVRIAVLVSGGGTNPQALIDAQNSGARCTAAVWKP